ncbi:MAG: hypothetical protein WAL63_19610 [Solirubrobacteraceae bacterium]
MTLAALHDALLAQGGTLAELVTAPNGDGGQSNRWHPPLLAASGPRAAGREREYELLLEMILEGSLLHYGAPRLIRCEDPDLALLLGDQLYALGLSRLAELGDLDAVHELADLISLLAQARAGSDAQLADAIWGAGAAAIGWGASPEHEAAKELARDGDARAAQALTGARDEALGGRRAGSK